MAVVLKCGLLLALSIILLTRVKYLQAGFTLRVNLLRYRNVSHRKSDGFCCDEESVCSSDCDNQFNFCLRPLTATDTCSYGEYESATISNDEITFSEQTIITSPLLFHTDNLWPGSAELLVSVNDQLSTDEANPLVVEFLIRVNITHSPSNVPISSTNSAVYRDQQGQGKFIELSFELQCKENFYGSDCGTFCAPRNDDSGHFTCDSNGNIVCMDGFADPSTNCIECILPEECSSTGGYCNSTDSCVCREEYAGENCDIDINVCRTMDVICQNDGTCVFDPSLENDFICSCSEGYSGITCDIDLDVCGHTSPCENNGLCINSGPGNYTCNCTHGYEGRTCSLETDECSENMCQNGAICKDLYLDYECECSRGYEGKNCEIELDGCIGQVCLNNGTCQNNHGDFRCECAEGFSGTFCSYADTSTEESTTTEQSTSPSTQESTNPQTEESSSPSSNLLGPAGPIIGGAVASGFLLIIIIILFIIIIYILRQRGRRKLVTNTYKEADDPTASSQQVFSVDNPAFLDTSNQVESQPIDERFDNPIYAQSSQAIPTDGHYSRLQTRMGKENGGQPSILAPASSSVVELLNSIADYSTLNDSMRTQSTTVSNAHDHQYEQIERGRFTMDSHAQLCDSIDQDSDHDYSSLDQSIPGAMSTQVAAPHKAHETEAESGGREGTGLCYPYENLMSSSTSPRSGATKHVKYDQLALKTQSGEQAQIGGMPGVGEALELSDLHDYDSVECGVYENSGTRVVGTAHLEETAHSPYNDTLP